MKLYRISSIQGNIVQDEQINEIFELLNGKQSDRNDSGLCGDVQKNTDFRKDYETKRDKIWLAVIISWILAIISFFQDKILG